MPTAVAVRDAQIVPHDGSIDRLALQQQSAGSAHPRSA